MDGTLEISIKISTELDIFEDIEKTDQFELHRDSSRVRLLLLPLHCSGST